MLVVSLCEIMVAGDIKRNFRRRCSVVNRIYWWQFVCIGVGKNGNEVAIGDLSAQSISVFIDEKFSLWWSGFVHSSRIN